MSTVLRRSASSTQAQETDHIVNYMQQLEYSTKHNEIQRAYYAKSQFFWEFGRKPFKPQKSQILAGQLLTWKAGLQSQTCCHLHTLESWVSIWTSSQREQTCDVPVAESLPAIFANGSSLRDLRSRDTGQLEKGKHKSLELSRERFTILQRCFFWNWKSD